MFFVYILLLAMTKTFAKKIGNGRYICDVKSCGKVIKFPSKVINSGGCLDLFSGNSIDMEFIGKTVKFFGKELELDIDENEIELGISIEIISSKGGTRVRIGGIDGLEFGNGYFIATNCKQKYTLHEGSKIGINGLSCPGGFICDDKEICKCHKGKYGLEEM